MGIDLKSLINNALAEYEQEVSPSDCYVLNNMSIDKDPADSIAKTVQYIEPELDLLNDSGIWVRYEKLICFHSYTATTNEKFVGSIGILTRADLNSHLRVSRLLLYPLSQQGLVASLIQFKWTKYFHHGLTLVF